MSQNKPTFLILGAAKSGTTTLHDYLGRHPDVVMATPKEPVFFETEYERGLEFYWRCYFKKWKGEKEIGEARVANLFLPFVPHRIKTMLPAAKFLTILRNPVDRAYSHWWMNYCSGVDRLSFEEAIGENQRRLEKGNLLEGDGGARFWKSHMMAKRPHVSLRVYLDVGCYSEQLERYFDLFPEKNIKILFFGDLLSSPGSFFRDVCEFLRIDQNKAPKKIVPGNVGYSKGMRPFVLLDQKIPVSKVLPSGFRNVLRPWLMRLGKRPQMDPETRARLIHHYAGHNRELEGLLGKDLSHWDSTGYKI